MIAIVPLRGGSKSIPLKNIKPIAGKPLCYWALKSAIACKLFDKIVVSTDSDEIGSLVNSLSMPTVEILKRPADISGDLSTTEESMHHLLKHYPTDVICLIQATSPLTEASDFINAYKTFTKEGADSLLTGVLTKRFFWTKEGTPLNYNPENRPMRQQFAGTIMENGAFYFTKREILEKYNSRLGGKIVAYQMGSQHDVELDEKEDWPIVESILQAREPKVSHAIKLVASDIDGTLTDGGMYYAENGDELKKFNTKDGMGFQLLREKGIKTALITGEKVYLNHRRAQKMKVDYFYYGVKDKVAVMREIAQKEGLNLSEVAFIGDDINDKALLEIVGLKACVNDAVSDLKQISGIIVLKSRGGDGAFREFTKLILDMKGAQ